MSFEERWRCLWLSLKRMLRRLARLLPQDVVAGASFLKKQKLPEEMMKRIIIASWKDGITTNAIGLRNSRASLSFHRFQVWWHLRSPNTYFFIRYWRSQIP